MAWDYGLDQSGGLGPDRNEPQFVFFAWQKHFLRWFGLSDQLQEVKTHYAVWCNKYTNLALDIDVDFQV